MDEEIYVGDRAAIRFRYEGTQTGPGYVPPTGKKITATGIIILHFKNGKISEDWTERDILRTMQQLGFTLIYPSVVTEK